MQAPWTQRPALAVRGESAGLAHRKSALASVRPATKATGAGRVRDAARPLTRRLDTEARGASAFSDTPQIARTAVPQLASGASVGHTAQSHRTLLVAGAAVPPTATGDAHLASRLARIAEGPGTAARPEGERLAGSSDVGLSLTSHSRQRAKRAVGAGRGLAARFVQLGQPSTGTGAAGGERAEASFHAALAEVTGTPHIRPRGQSTRAVRNREDVVLNPELAPRRPEGLDAATSGGRKPSAAHLRSPPQRGIERGARTRSRSARSRTPQRNSDPGSHTLLALRIEPSRPRHKSLSGKFPQTPAGHFDLRHCRNPSLPP